MSIPSGWYPDPLNSDRERRWSSEAGWSDETRPLLPPPGAPEPIIGKGRNRKRTLLTVLGISGGVIALVIFVVFSIGYAESDPFADWINPETESTSTIEVPPEVAAPPTQAPSPTTQSAVVLSAYIDLVEVYLANRETMTTSSPEFFLSNVLTFGQELRVASDELSKYLKPGTLVAGALPTESALRQLVEETGVYATMLINWGGLEEATCTDEANKRLDRTYAECVVSVIQFGQEQIADQEDDVARSIELIQGEVSELVSITTATPSE